MLAARLRDLETAIIARLGATGRQVIHFGSEVLGPEMMSTIWRLVLQSSRKVSVVVCEDGSDTSQFADLIKTAFDGIANKYQIYSDAAIGGRSVSFKDDHGWAEFCLPQLDTAIVKKLLTGNLGSFFKSSAMTGGLLPRELHNLNRWLVAHRALPFAQRDETPAIFRGAPAIPRVVSF